MPTTVQQPQALAPEIEKLTEKGYICYMAKRECSLSFCNRPHEGNGYCKQHNRQWKQGKPLLPIRRHESGRTCEVEGCNRPHEAKGYCNFHYYRFKTGGDMGTPSGHGGIREGGNRRGEGRATCSVDGCEKMVKGRGLCSRHYDQWRYENDPEYRTRKIKQACKRNSDRLRGYILDLAARDGWVCGRPGGKKGCGALLRIDLIHVDHVIPRARGGSDDFGNLQLLCAECNMRWGSKLEGE